MSETQVCELANLHLWFGLGAFIYIGSAFCLLRSEKRDSYDAFIIYVFGGLFWPLASMGWMVWTLWRRIFAPSKDSYDGY